MVGGKTLVILFSILISIHVFAETPTNEQYWNQTGLNFDIVKDKFKSSCHKNQKSFIACIRALNDAALMLKPAAVFALDSEVKAGSPIIGPLKKDYGTLKLYRYKWVPNAKLATYWPQYSHARDLQIKYGGELFEQRLYQAVDFASILTDLKSEVLVGKLADSEGLVAATLINSFLGSAVDPHTRIQPLAQIDDNSKSLDVSFVGIGAIVSSSNSQFIVQSPVLNSPAFVAGLKSNDVITSINGEKIEKKDLADITKALKGPEGSTVKVGLLRKGTPLEIQVIRGKVTIPNLQAQWLNDTQIPVGYIKLSSFMETDICEKMATAINDFQQKGAQGLILDLRQNGGGFMNMAICIGSLFLGKKLIVSQVDLKGNQKFSYIGDKNAVTKLPLVTLIDGGSASASEILSGALQDYQRSWLLGDRSYGKASVQAESPWNGISRPTNLRKRFLSWFDSTSSEQNQTIGLWHTISRFYQPSGRTNQIVGITPDFAVDPFPNATEEDKFVLREADLYTNALPPLGPTWKQPRAEQVSAISACMTSSGAAQQIFDKKRDDAISPDYRLIAAQILLNCDK
jgi:C-terminal peptidase prc